MKIAIVGDSSSLFMPYVYNYKNILEDKNADFIIISWDRLKVEQDNKYTYKDTKKKHRKNYFDYVRYCNFVKKVLADAQYDKLVICGIPLAYFLKRCLIYNYKQRYILDIRDYHKLIKFAPMGALINNSSFTVLSSPNFRRWLPDSDKYIINHNTRINGLDKLKNSRSFPNKSKVRIAYIGAIRDYQININFIDSIKNNGWIDLYFHGEGDINEDIQKYLKHNGIKNVYLTGLYSREDEANLYLNSDMVNLLIPSHSVNDKTLLTNRLYNALIFGKPILTFHDTYTAQIVEDYGLGLIIDSFTGVEGKIAGYIKGFNKKRYDVGRSSFLKGVIEENKYFQDKLEGFIE